MFYYMFGYLKNILHVSRIININAATAVVDYCYLQYIEYSVVNVYVHTTMS